VHKRLRTTAMPAPDLLGCEENLQAFDRSPQLQPVPTKRESESPSDAASLLMLLSAASESEPHSERSTPQLPPAACSVMPPEELLASFPSSSHQQSGDPRPTPPKRGVVKVDRVLRCGACEGCRRGDCGRCPNCRDKPKFGGAGVKKQACNHRRCLQPTRTGMGHRDALRQAMTGQPAYAEDDSDASEAASQDSTIPYGSPARRDPSDLHTIDETELPYAAASSRDYERVTATIASRPSPGLSRDTAGLIIAHSASKQARARSQREPGRP